MIAPMHINIRHLTALMAALLCWTGAAGAQDLRRAGVWDLKLGQPIAATTAVVIQPVISWGLRTASA